MRYSSLAIFIALVLQFPAWAGGTLILSPTNQGSIAAFSATHNYVYYLGDSNPSGRAYPTIPFKLLATIDTQLMAFVVHITYPKTKIIPDTLNIQPGSFLYSCTSPTVSDSYFFNVVVEPGSTIDTLTITGSRMSDDSKALGGWTTSDTIELATNIVFNRCSTGLIDGQTLGTVTGLLKFRGPNNASADFTTIQVSASGWSLMKKGGAGSTWVGSADLDNDGWITTDDLKPIRRSGMMGSQTLVYDADMDGWITTDDLKIIRRLNGNSW